MNNPQVTAETIQQLREQLVHFETEALQQHLPIALAEAKEQLIQAHPHLKGFINEYYCNETLPLINWLREIDGDENYHFITEHAENAAQLAQAAMTTITLVTAQAPTNNIATATQGFVITDQLVRLTKITLDNLIKFREQAKQLALSPNGVNPLDLIDSIPKATIEQILLYSGVKRDIAAGWQTGSMSIDSVMATMIKAMNDKHSTLSLSEQLRRLKPNFTDPASFPPFLAFTTKLATILSNHDLTDLESGTEKQLVQQLLDSFKGPEATDTMQYIRYSMLEKGSIGSLHEFKDRLATVYAYLKQCCDVARRVGYLPKSQINGKRTLDTRPDTNDEDTHKSKRNKNYAVKKPTIDNDNVNADKLCTACGRQFHDFDNCSYVKASDSEINPDKHTPWVTSAKGVYWKSRGFDTLPSANHRAKMAAGTATAPTASTSSSSGGKPYHKRHFKRKGNDINEQLCTCETCDLVNSITTTTKEISSNYPSIIQCYLHLKHERLTYKCLIDTGALQSNYCSPEVAEALRRNHAEEMTQQSALICSPINNACTTNTNVYACVVQLFDDNVTLKPVRLEIKTLSSFSKKYDLIIGMNTILKHNLLKSFAHRLQPAEEGQGDTGSDQPAPYTQLGANVPNPNLSNDSELLSSVHDISTIEGEEDIPEKESALTWDAPLDSPAESNIPTKIYGSSELQAKLRALCTEFQDIFSRVLTTEPARIKPLTLEVDQTEWEQPKHRLPPRLQSTEKEAEIRRQIEHMLSINLIRASNTPYYSQVLLTPKPNGKWRFCIDYRHLNLLLKQLGWPLPHIHQMLQRIGSQKPKLFCKFDMTHGYHQAPLSESSKYLTAFITFMGVYEFNRLPMGVMPASSYFQKAMSTEVLAGLLHIICELLIDDLAVFGQTDDSLIERLRKIFERLRAFNVKLNSDKCELGLSEMEFVGHLLDHEGISFSKSKIDGISEFPLPLTCKQLKSFLGLANYFRDHVKNHSMIVYPLQQMIEGYSRLMRHRRLVWTPQQTETFEAVKLAISNCQKLYYVDPEGHIHLQTDASDYGIGAYLFQLVNEKEYPIMFISKSLTKVQLRWSVPEKECYAIIHALNKMEHLLRDRHFTLWTDHQNLTRIYTTGSAKVHRWQLRLQEFDHDKKFLNGASNQVADNLSRLCPVSDKTEYLTAIEEEMTVSDYYNTLSEPTNISYDTDILATVEEIKTIPHDIYKKISTVHNSTAGHHGVDKTLRKLLRANNTFKNMRTYVTLFIKQCPCCQKLSQI